MELHLSWFGVCGQEKRDILKHNHRNSGTERKVLVHWVEGDRWEVRASRRP